MRRAFALASAAIFVDEVVYVALFPLLPTYANELSLGKVGAGLLVSSYPILMLLGGLPAGLLCDRLGSRRLLLIGTIMIAAASIAFGFADTLWELWLSRGAQGLGSALTSVAGMAAIAHGALAGRRATVIGLATALQGLSALAGPALGGYLVPALGSRLAFSIPAVFGGVLVALLLVTRWDDAGTSALQSVRGLVRAALRGPAVRGSVACILTCGFVGGAAQTLVPLRLGAAGFSPGEIGTVFVIAATIGLGLAPLAGRLADRRGIGAVATVWAAVVVLLLVGMSASAGVTILLAFSVALWPLLRVGGALGFALGAEHGALGAGLATGYGLALSAWAAGAMAGPLVAGSLAAAYGDGTAFACAATVVVLVSVPIVAARRLRAGEAVVG